MKKTKMTVTGYDHEKGIPIIGETITCEVAGEMSTGEKVWQDIETGEQWYLGRVKLTSHYLEYFYEQ